MTASVVILSVMMWVNNPVERHTAIKACTFIRALELHPAFTVHGPKMSIEIRENGASTLMRWYEAIFEIIVLPLSLAHGIQNG